MTSRHSRQDSTTEFSLADLAQGETGEVVRLNMEGDARRRLMDLGFVPGSAVTPLFHSPLGDPTSYRIRGAMIALRAIQAREITVRRIPDYAEKDPL